VTAAVAAAAIFMFTIMMVSFTTEELNRAAAGNEVIIINGAKHVDFAKKGENNFNRINFPKSFQDEDSDEMRIKTLRRTCQKLSNSSNKEKENDGLPGEPLGLGAEV